MNNQREPGTQNEKRLDSWKEIAHYLQRNTATVRRWEKEEGLPVHRHSHKTRGSVYAYTGEIEAWRETRKPVAEPALPVPLLRRVLTPAFAAVMVLSIATVGSFRVVDAQVGLTKTLVCSGTDCRIGPVSPDGKWIAARNGGKLLVQEIATKKERVLVEMAANNRIGDICFSPDGSRLAYNQMIFTQNGQRHEDKVLVVNRHGGDSHTIAGEGSPIAWSPDGKRLLVRVDAPDRSSIDTLQWVTISNGAVQKLPDHDYIDVKLSPDGKFLAFLTSDSGKQWSIHVMARDGSGENQLSPYSTRPTLIDWTPDGRYLVFRPRSASLGAVRISNGRIQGPAIDTRADIPQTANLLGIDRSGALYYERVFDSVAQVMASLDQATGKATSAPQPIPLSSGESNNLLPRFSPDGRRIVFFRKTPNEAMRELRIYSFDSGREETFRTRAEMSGGRSCWTPDGQSIIMNAWRESPRVNGGPGARLIEPVQVDLETREEKELFPAASSSFHLTSCSGDILVGVDPAGVGLKIRNSRTGMEKEIYRFATRRQMDSQGPRLSWDGSQIAFFDQFDIETTALLVISTSGGPVRKLTTAKTPDVLSGYCTAWSPDNRFVYFCKHERDDTAETFRVSADGGPVESTGYKGPAAGGIEISPDGTRIVSGWGQWQEPQIWTVRNFLPR